MKKMITAFALILSMGYAKAQTDSARTAYDYYPDANIYYNDAAKTYWYYDSTSSKWQNNAQLPLTYSIDDKSWKNSFYYNGANVWEKNAEHKKKYGKKAKSVKKKN